MMRRAISRWTVGASLVVAFLFMLPAGVSADTLGENVTFHVNPSYDYAGAGTITATLQSAGTDAYWYVDDRYWQGLSSSQRSSFRSDLDALASQFDTVIYPRETSFWGSEAKPGVDGDARVTILLERMNSGSGGYFETINNYPVLRAPDSNAREMVYVNVNAVGTSYDTDFVAHEFQHLISFNQKDLINNVEDDVWLNEARSEYAITQTGYNSPYQNSALQRRVFTFTLHPSDSLVDWPNTTNDYAIAATFIHYVAEQYGPTLVSAAGRNPYAGIEALEQAIAATGRTDRFADIFMHWMAAVTINDPTQSLYSYRSDGLRDIHINPTIDVSISPGSVQSFVTSVSDWQPVWARYSLSGAGTDDMFAADLRGDGIGQFHMAYAYRTTDGLWHVVNLAPFSTAASVRLAASGVNEVILMTTQGLQAALGSATVASRQLQVSAQMNPPDVLPSPASTGTVQPQQTATGAGGLTEGDLIRRNDEPDIYVIAGAYKRYLPPGILELYGFENRPVISVDAATFVQYAVSNYMRPFGQLKVYAAWPDGTKHWLNMTADYFTASGRDWGAIFTINDAEAAWYRTGPDITR